MIFARIDTAHYRFEALAGDEKQARALLLEAWRAHCAQNPYADPSFMADAIEGGDVNVNEIELGHALRDGERIV